MFLGGRGKNFSVGKKLYRNNFVTGMKYFSFQRVVNIMQNVVSAVVEKHPNHTEWDDELSELMQKLIDRRYTVEIFETAERSHRRVVLLFFFVFFLPHRVFG